MRTLIVPSKAYPKNGGRQGACLADECRRDAQFGRLCGRHQLTVLRDVNRDLKAVGLKATRAAANDSGYINADIIDLGRKLVHRAIIEVKIGRPLVGQENVHHINGVRCDNAPDNLELWVTSQPAGQRPEDLAAWARTTLARYGTDDERALYRRTA